MNTERLYALKILKKCRQELINRFIDKDALLYKAMFKYERNSVAMNLSKDKFFTEWINNHFEIIQQDSSVLNVKEVNIALFYIKQLILNSKCENDSLLYQKLLMEKRKIIDNILYTDDKMENKFNELSLSYEKDKALFDRELIKYLNHEK